MKVMGYGDIEKAEVLDNLPDPTDDAGHDLLTTREHLDDDPKHIDDYRAVAVAEGFEQSSYPDEERAAWQHLVDTGLAWQLQGWFGRRAKELIAAGFIHERRAA